MIRKKTPNAEVNDLELKNRELKGRGFSETFFFNHEEFKGRACSADRRQRESDTQEIDTRPKAGVGS